MNLVQTGFAVEKYGGILRLSYAVYVDFPSFRHKISQQSDYNKLPHTAVV